MRDENDAPVPGERDYVVLGLLVNNRPDAPLTMMVYLRGERVSDWGWIESSRANVTEPSLPPNWVYWQHERDSFSLLPRAWTRPGHWDDLFSDERTLRDRAWSDHRAERDLILKHAGRPPGRGGSVRIAPARPPRRA